MQPTRREVFDSVGKGYEASLKKGDNGNELFDKAMDLVDTEIVDRERESAWRDIQVIRRNCEMEAKFTAQLDDTIKNKPDDLRHQSEIDRHIISLGLANRLLIRKIIIEKETL